MRKYIYYNAVVKYKGGNNMLYFNLLVLVGYNNNLLRYELREGWSNERITGASLVSTNTVLPIHFHDISDILKKNGIDCNHETRKEYFDNLFSDKFNIIESKYY